MEEDDELSAYLEELGSTEKGAAIKILKTAFGEGSSSADEEAGYQAMAEVRTATYQECQREAIRAAP